MRWVLGRAGLKCRLVVQLVATLVWLVGCVPSAVVSSAIWSGPSFSAGQPWESGASRAGQAAPKPNILLILADDLDEELGTLDYTPRIRALAEEGATFANYFANVSLCCPSRTSLLRGQYAHNTQVMGNIPPIGGFEVAHALGLENSTVATWLQGAGYRTGLMGKYLNGYPASAEPTYVPPGWDEWASPAAGNPYSNYNYTLNENGRLVPYGRQPADYVTDVLANKASAFVRQSAAEGRPFFLYLATYAPHQPATPAPRHVGAMAGSTAPHSPSFDEEDVSDKPAWVRSRRPLSEPQLAQIDSLWRRRVESMLAVDEMIGNLVETLRAAGQLDNTYVVFTSDNGFHLGQHRLLPGKSTAYEEDIRLPLIVRGPGVPAGAVLPHLAGNVDLAPTFATIAGAPAPDFVDGRSLLPLLGASPPPTEAWRGGYLIEHEPERGTRNEAGPSTRAPGLQHAPSPPAAPATDPGLLEPPDPFDLDPAQTQPRGRLPAFKALRTADYLYVSYITGERELYDLRADPFELRNLQATADPTLLARLAAWLDALAGCRGAGCRTADLAPPSG